MESDERLENTACYLAYYYAKNNSTTYIECMKDYSSKFTKDVLIAAVNKWRQKFEAKGIATTETIALTANAIKDNIWKALKVLAETTIQNQSVFNLKLYPVMDDQAIVIGHLENTSTTRVIEAQRAVAKTFEQTIVGLQKQITDLAKAVTTLQQNAQAGQGRYRTGKNSTNNTNENTSLNLQVPQDNRTRSNSVLSNASKRAKPNDGFDIEFPDLQSQSKSNNDGFTEVKSKKEKKKKNHNDNSKPRSPLISATGNPIKGNMNAAPKITKCIAINLDKSLTVDDLKTYCKSNTTLSPYVNMMEFNEVSNTYNGIKIRVICKGWPSANTIAFGDKSLWPRGATIKTLKSNQKELEQGFDPNKRRFVCKLFSNLKPEQTLEGVKSCVENHYKVDMSDDEEVEVHVKEFTRKNPRKTDRKAFIALVVPKDRSKRIKDILEEKYPMTGEFNPRKIVCRPWGNTIPEDLAKLISDGTQREDDGVDLMA